MFISQALSINIFSAVPWGEIQRSCAKQRKELVLTFIKLIGLLKALGATNSDILSLFIGEAAGIGLLGGLGGTTLGLVLGSVINAFSVPYLQEQASSSGAATITSAVYIPFYLPVFAIVFSTIIGSVSGLYAALKAQSMPPVIALKYE